MNKDYATNKELNNTKEELLDKLVSKKDLQNEINKLVTKKEFQSEIRRVDGSLEMLANEVGENTLEIQKLCGEMNDKFNMVLTAIDGLSGQMGDSRTEKAAGEHKFRRHEQRFG